MSEDPAQKAQAIDLHSERASVFDAHYRGMESDPYRSAFTYGRLKIEELIDAELDRISLPARALDAGCGTGFNLARLRGRGFEVVGLEPSPSMRELARSNNPGAQIDDGDIEQLPYDDRSFDLILCIEVIRYLLDPSTALKELARVLRPGGTAIITAAPRLSFNGYGAINQVTSRVSVPSFPKIKQSFMTVKSAERAASQAGFVDVEVHGAFLGPWRALDRLAPSALPRLLRRFEPWDARVSDRPAWRNFTNHLIIVGRGSASP